VLRDVIAFPVDDVLGLSSTSALLSTAGYVYWVHMNETAGALVQLRVMRKKIISACFHLPALGLAPA
jgi:hypothetical protein